MRSVYRTFVLSLQSFSFTEQLREHSFKQLIISLLKLPPLQLNFNACPLFFQNFTYLNSIFNYIKLVRSPAVPTSYQEKNLGKFNFNHIRISIIIEDIATRGQDGLSLLRNCNFPWKKKHFKSILVFAENHQKKCCL